MKVSNVSELNDVVMPLQNISVNMLIQESISNDDIICSNKSKLMFIESNTNGKRINKRSNRISNLSSSRNGSLFSNCKFIKEESKL